jgi:hypothetical protein
VEAVRGYDRCALLRCEQPRHRDLPAQIDALRVSNSIDSRAGFNERACYQMAVVEGLETRAQLELAQPEECDEGSFSVRRLLHQKWRRCCREGKLLQWRLDGERKPPRVPCSLRFADAWRSHGVIVAIAAALGPTWKASHYFVASKLM